MPSRKTAKPTAKPADTATAAAPPPARAARALSLHIGLNAVDPAHYSGWDGPLTACEFDAHDMAALATARGMVATRLLTRAATRAKVLAALRAAAKTLKAGDLFFVSYSGHGGQVPDTHGDEPDRQDETWCLHDGQLIDDELYLELGRFAAGVRILMLSDSCHSGTVARAPMTTTTAPAGSAARPRLLPPAVARRTYQAHQAFYDGLQAEVRRAAGSAVVDPDTVLAALPQAGTRLTALAARFRPALILISGCQDNQTSMDGEHNGAFTERLLRVWNGGRFVGSYPQFHARIRAGMPASQSPNLFTLGAAGAFLKQAPFSV